MTAVADGCVERTDLVAGVSYDEPVLLVSALICRTLLSTGRARRPSRLLGTGASCFAVEVVAERVVVAARSG